MTASDGGRPGSDVSVPSSVAMPAVAGLYRLLDFAEKRGSVGGSLIMFQPGVGPGSLPFPVRKVLFMSALRPDDVRGGHAHFETQEVLVCLQGACTVDLDDGRDRRASVRLAKKQQGLLLYPHVWRTVREFAEGTLLLALADAEYDERDYIRDRASYETLAAEWSAFRGDGLERSGVMRPGAP